MRAEAKFRNVFSRLAAALGGRGGASGHAAFVDAPAVVHPTARVDASAQLGADVTVGPRASIGSGAQVCWGVQIGADAFVDPGAVLSNHVKVGRGATVRAGVTVGAGSVVARKATVTKDVPAGSRVARDGTVHPGATGRGALGPNPSPATRALVERIFGDQS